MDPTRTDAPLQRLHAHFARHPRWFVLTGAGISTASGIPDYRDADGGWKRKPPVTVQAFVGDRPTRSRYWARSLVGWPRIAAAQPNDAHCALAALSHAGRLAALVTQNVDGLHQRAGTADVIDLHGRLDTVVCLSCSERTPRAAMQQALESLNPEWAERAAEWAAAWAGMALHSDGTPLAGVATAPDGDADIEQEDFAGFRVPSCRACGGMLKPDVVFYGENVPRPRVDVAFAALDRADAVLVAGSSLMVFSGFRFAREAAARGLPVVAVNLGRTRADDLLTDKIALPCDVALASLADPVAPA